MKIKLVDVENNLDSIKAEIKAGKVQFVSENEDYILMGTHCHKNSLIGKVGSDIFILDPKSILYVKADGNDSICVTKDKEYYIREKIYEIEAFLYEHRFLRVSRSHVININMIKSITPTYNMKYKLTMKNMEIIYVTRSYYYIFKEYLGI